jgi:hypothetical protein
MRLLLKHVKPRIPDLHQLRETQHLLMDTKKGSPNKCKLSLKDD